MTTLKPEDLVGLKCSFDRVVNGKTVRVVGIITAAVGAEPFGPSKIPDFHVTVRGGSGAQVKVSMCETYMSLPDR